MYSTKKTLGVQFIHLQLQIGDYNRTEAGFGNVGVL